MKKVMIGIAFVACTTFPKAQTFNELFKQKETQIRYLIEQIAALKTYRKVIAKGYNITNEGAHFIFNSKDGDYKQHSAYFSSLLKVKPVIKSYSKVASIQQMNTWICQQSKQIKIMTSEFLSSQERGYLLNIFSNVSIRCKDLNAELETIISENQLALKDDERIVRIDKIYFEMEDCFQFCVSLINEIKVLVNNRMREAGEINKLLSLYGIQ